MSALPQPTRPIHRPSPVAGPERHADVIEIRPWLETRSPAAPAPIVDPWEETVILGRWVPHPVPSIESVARPPMAPAMPSVSTSTSAHGPAVATPIVDQAGLHDLLVNRGERYYSAPPPPRVQHRRWMLSSILIAGGGILAVMIAGELGSVPLVGTIALLATMACGAILVAAQLTDEVRRARNGSAAASAPTTTSIR